MGVATRQFRAPTALAQYRQQRRTLRVAHAGLILGAVFFAQVMRIFGIWTGVGMAVLLILVVLTTIRPAAGLGIAAILAIVGDARAMPWWPAVKNLSSRESILYVNDQLSINPFEILLGIVIAVWIISRLLSADPSPALRFGPLSRPLALFGAMVIFGLIWGVGRGGDLRIAIFEARPLLYIPVIAFVAANLFTSLDHYHRLLWWIAAALTVESVHGLWRLEQIREAWAEPQSPVEHTAALHMNLLLLFVIATLWLARRSLQRRLLLIAMATPTLIFYLSAERRAAVVALIVGVAFLAAVLAGRNPQKFMRVVPMIALIGVAYLGAFWNVEEGIGFPAQAVKTVIAPDTRSEADASSDLYRQIENFNLVETIKSSPITGIGFGQQFLRPVQLPDISSFEFWAYIPHNSLMWMWTQVGFVGYIAFLYIFGCATALGVRAARRVRDPDDAAMIAVFAAYVPMTLVVAFVDITFDVQTTVLLGICLALLTTAHRVLDEEHDSRTEPAEATTAGAA